MSGIVGNSGLYSSSVENEQNLGTIEITDVNNPNFYQIANELRHVKCADCRGNEFLTEGVDYEIVYSNFNIVPKKAAIRSFVAAKKAAVLNFFKNDGGITGYQINYAYDSKFKAAKSKNLSKVKYKTVTIKKKKYSYSAYKITGLKSKKYVYVRIRAYKQVGKTKIYGSWSGSKKVKIK